MQIKKMLSNRLSQKLTLAVLAVCCLIPSGRLTADEGGKQDLTALSIEELSEVRVFGASRYEQPVAEAPSSISMITRDEIQKHGYRTLAEILQSVRGIYVTYDRNYSYIGVRGFNRPGDTNSRILLLLDGHRITENLYDSSYYGTDAIIDIDLIDRVEVIRGAGSSLYGSNAFFAVINVITRKGRNLGVELSGDAGSLQSYKTRISHGRQFTNGTDVLLSGSWYDSQGHKSLYYREFDDPATNHGTAENADKDRNYSLFTKLHSGDFTFTGAYVRRTKNIPTAPYETVFNDSRSRTRDALGFMDLSFVHAFNNGTDLQARINYSQYRFNGRFAYDATKAGLPDAISIYRADDIGEWLGAELLVSKTFPTGTRITLGTEYRNNLKQHLMSFNEDPQIVFSDNNRSSSIHGIFMQTELHIQQGLLLNAGMRYDHYHSTGGTANPRIALIYQPHDTSTFKLIYAQAFRAPDIWEVIGEEGVIKSNPALKPETIRTWEAIFEQRLGNNLTLTINGYYSRIRDLISQVDDPGADPFDPADDLLMYRNTDNATAQGAELELAGRHAGNISWWLSYSRQRTVNTDTRRELNNSPRHLGKAGVSLPLLSDRIFAGLDARYQSNVRTVGGNKAASFWVANATLFTRKLLRGLEASVSLYNLFGKQYGYPGSTEHRQDIIEQDGRTFRVKLTYTF